LLCLLAFATTGPAPAAVSGAGEISVERLDDAPPAAGADTLDWVRASNRVWSPSAEPGFLPAAQSRWWRLKVKPGADTGTQLVLVLRDVFDARLVAYAPPAYLPQVLDRFSTALNQPGSAERLLIALDPSASAGPIYLFVDHARLVPIGLSVTSLNAHLADDLARVRFNHGCHVALLLLGLVAAIYAVALRSYFMLLLAGWCVGACVYLLVISAEIRALPGIAPLLPHTTFLASLGASGGLLLAFAFMVRFLHLDTNHQRIAQSIRGLLLLNLALLVWQTGSDNSPHASQALNAVILLLMVMTTVGAVLRIRAGDPNGWFYFAAWVPVQTVIATRVMQLFVHLPTPPWLDYGMPLAMAATSFVLVLATAREARLAEIDLQVARERARIDPLTGLPNRTQLDAILADDRRNARGPLTVLFLDLDRFKAINDHRGHAVGDRCLIAVADVLRREASRDVVVARYGGEEFVMVIRNHPLAAVLARAEAIRLAIAALRLPHGDAVLTLTTSIGVAMRADGESYAEVLRRADMALYQAKREGRDRVVVASEQPNASGSGEVEKTAG